MLVHYWRRAVQALAADRFFSLVNLLGLSVGLASVAIIFLYVKHEFSHDTWLPQHETLFRIDTVETAPGQAPVEIARAPGPLKGALIKDFPQIRDISRAYPAEVSVLRQGQPFRETILAADPNFFSLLGLPFASGSQEHALRETGSVALSERAARRYFGIASPIGRRLTIVDAGPRDYVVSAVFKDIPDNSHMAFDLVIPFEAYFGANTEEVRAIPEEWGGAYFHTYARLRPGTDVNDVEKGLPALVQRSLPRWLTDLLGSARNDFYRFRFVPVAQVHFEGAANGAMKPGGSRVGVLTVASVALLILMIASINFANLTAARSSLRVREVALRKVLGARRVQILLQFLTEAALLTLVAGVIAAAIVELLLPWLGRLVGIPISAAAGNDLSLWAAIACLVAITALASGIYPSVVMSRVRPALALNRSFERRRGGKLRGVLVVLQFAVSIGLIATAAVMVLQTRFAGSADLGFDRENVLILRLPEGPQQEALAKSFMQALSNGPDIVAVASSSAVPSDPSEDNLSVRGPGAVKPTSLGFHKVDPRFFELYRVRPLSGRTETMLREDAAVGTSREQQRAEPVVLNRAALTQLGISSPEAAVGELLHASGKAYTIAGVVPDMHFRSLHQPVRPEMYMLEETAGGVLSIRYRPGDMSRLLGFVDRTWRERVADRPVSHAFLDDQLNALYQRERTQALLLSVFSGIAIVLSCLGLLAMAAFTLQRRIKEIAVRKVLGAGTADIARLLLWDMSKPVLLANLIAWPVAWLVLRDWLDGFAYRIDLPLSVFPLAGLGALLIAVAAVGVQAMKAARTHPAMALKHE